MRNIAQRCVLEMLIQLCTPVVFGPWFCMGMYTLSIPTKHLDHHCMMLQAIANFQGQVASREVEKITHMLEVPLAGLDADSVMQELEDRAGNDFRYADGESKATGTIYMAGDVHRELLNDAYCMFSQANPLHTDLFPSIRRMEAEVVAMTASLLGGGHQGVREVQPHFSLLVLVLSLIHI